MKTASIHIVVTTNYHKEEMELTIEYPPNRAVFVWELGLLIAMMEPLLSELFNMVAQAQL